MSLQTGEYLEICERLVSAFERAAEARGIYHKRLNANMRQRMLRDRFKQWQDGISITQHRLEADQDGGFSQVAIINLKPRPKKKRKPRTHLPIFVIATNPATHKIALFKLESDIAHLFQLRAQLCQDYSELKNVLRRYDGSCGPFNHDHTPAYTVYDNIENLEAELNGRINKAIEYVVPIIENGAKALRYRQEERAATKALAAEITRTVLAEAIKPVLRDFKASLHQPSLDDAKALQGRVAGHSHKTSLLGLYNLLAGAPSERARHARVSAAPMVARTGGLHMSDATLWGDIDDGASPYVAIGKKFDVKPHTIKQIFKTPVPKLKFKAPLKWVDHINPDRWPSSDDDVFYFNLLCEMADMYGKAFERDGPESLAKWVKEAGKNMSWKGLAQQKFDKTHKAMLALSDEDLENLMLVFDRHSRTEICRYNLKHDHRFWRAGVRRYGNTLNDVRDFKNAFTRHIIRPAVLTSFERLPILKNKPDFAIPMSNAVAKKLWAACPPSEQLAASDYWHSGAINFKDRFESIAGITGTKWHSILKAPTVIDGVRIVPLGSDKALREEADAMKHCVWSYGINCLRDNYHIFSLRDAQTGARLSTLNLVDEKDDEGNVRFCIKQNRSVHNNTPLDVAIQAGVAFCDALNKGQFDIDWAPIEDDRETYALQMIDESVEYDFHDPEIARRVFELYEPCMPRKLARDSGATLEGMVDALGIVKAIRERYLDPIGGGLHL